MTMNKHFSYLLDDQSRDFFQKVAEDNARASSAPRAPVPFTKTASSPMVKLAQRIERDMGILKAAGPTGTGLGMCKRAARYIDRVMPELSPRDGLELFKKVAAEAISVDMEAAEDQLCRKYPGDEKWAHELISTVARDLVADTIKLASVLDLATEVAGEGLAGAKALREGAKGEEVLEGLRSSMKEGPGGVGSLGRPEEAERLATRPAPVSAPNVASDVGRGSRPSPIATKGNVLTKAQQGARLLPSQAGAYGKGLAGSWHDWGLARAGRHIEAGEMMHAQGQAMSAGAKSNAELSHAKSLMDSGKDMMAKGTAKAEVHASALEKSTGRNAKDLITPGGGSREYALKHVVDARGAREAERAAAGAEATKATTPSAPAANVTPDEMAGYQQHKATGGTKSLNDYVSETRARDVGAQRASGGRVDSEGRSVKDSGIPAGGYKPENPAGRGGPRPARGAAPGEAGEPAEPAAGYSGSMERFFKGEKLHPTDKARLWKAGLGGLGGYRLATGRDIVSGDKN